MQCNRVIVQSCMCRTRWRADVCLRKEGFTWTLAEIKPRGRSRGRWIDSINELWNAVDLEVRTVWQIIARDGEKWEEVVFALEILCGSLSQK